MRDVHILFGFKNTGLRIGGIFVGEAETMKALECIRREDDLTELMVMSGNCLDITCLSNETVDELSTLQYGLSVFRLVLRPIWHGLDVTIIEELKPCVYVRIAANMELVHMYEGIEDKNARIEIVCTALTEQNAIACGRKIRDIILISNLWTPTKHIRTY